MGHRRRWLQDRGSRLSGTEQDRSQRDLLSKGKDDSRKKTGAEPGCVLRTSARWRRAAYSHKWGQPGMAWVGGLAWRRGPRLVQAAAKVQGQLAVAPGAV